MPENNIMPDKDVLGFRPVQKAHVGQAKSIVLYLRGPTSRLTVFLNPGQADVL